MNLYIEEKPKKRKKIKIKMEKELSMGPQGLFKIWEKCCLWYLEGMAQQQTCHTCGQT